MTTRSLSAPILTGVALLGVVLALNGCSTISDTLHRESEMHYDGYAQASGDWGPSEFPSWIPDDATDIRLLTTTDGTNEVARIDTASALPDECTDGPRRQLPFESRDWIPDVVSLDTVAHCGDWEVTPVDDGFVAWFSADEKGQQPTG